MSAPSWAELEALFHEALERAPDERAAFLAERCADRRELQELVEALIRTHESAVSALEVPPVMTPQPRLQPGMRLGSYEVLSELGAGTMGEVYRARDTRLGRDVAIKILPGAFTADPDRLARFEREARLLAALNHPNIATIHGFEEADGVRALVMELVEGPTLAEKLAHDSQRKARAGLPIAEALKIGGHIAEALEAAHGKGVMHRDLKPANVKLGHDGHVKLLDFGLAKAFSPDGSGSDMSHLPSIAATDLQAGMIVGTPAYMSAPRVC